MLEKYSVVLLKEGKINEPFVCGEKIFEESIVLCNLRRNFFEDSSYESVLNYFINKIPPYEYKNSYGEVVSNEVVAVIDAHNIQENIVFDQFAEVYSRYFIEKEEITLDDMLEKYYFDFHL